MTETIAPNIARYYEIHAMREAGERMTEIAARVGCQRAAVWQTLQRKTPPEARHRRTPIAQKVDADWCDCGSAKTISARECIDCAIQTQFERVTAGRMDQLFEWAEKHGVVPTVSEAADILQVSRGFAGDIVQGTFGPDTRKGSRNKTRRAWPA